MAALLICRRPLQTWHPTRLPFAILVVLLILSFTPAKELLAETNVEQAKLAANKEVVHKFYEQVINNGKIDALDDLVQPDVMLQLQSDWVSPVTGTNQVTGKDNLKKHYEAFHSIWAKKAEWFKVNFKPGDDMIAEGDTVAVRYDRTYLDRKSKKVVNRTAMCFYKVKEGKITAMYLLSAGPKYIE
jgi:ketosteroid isomerase-like protein